MYSYNVAFCRGGETTGSVGKRPAVDDNKQLVKPASFDTVEIGDTVNFRGRGDEKSSIGGKILKTGMLAALVVGGLGYAHKADLVGKLKNGKIKDILKKSDVITKPCYEACHYIKTNAKNLVGKYFKL